ncbi:MAG: glycosyltransferase family 2 protein [Candidatus Omnitrophota bacterium]
MAEASWRVHNFTQYKKSISIILLVYNEEEIIEDVIKGFYNKVIRNVPKARLIIAEDGSTDGTKRILQRLITEIPFHLIESRFRKGYTHALKDALCSAQTELLFFSDADGQHEPEDFFRLLAAIDDFGIVSGCRVNRRDPMHRLILSKIYNMLIFLLFGLRTTDINSGFKLITKEVFNAVRDDIGYFEYCAASELVLRAYLKGYKIQELPVCHMPRAVSKTKIFTTPQLPFIVGKCIKSLLKIRFAFPSKRIAA